jgi:hypothetical protein
MRFTHLKLENWRNFLSADLPLLQRAFVVGPNASGKSNLLDAFRFLRDVADPQGGWGAIPSSIGRSSLWSAMEVELFDRRFMSCRPVCLSGGGRLCMSRCGWCGAAPSMCRCESVAVTWS